MFASRRRQVGALAALGATACVLAGQAGASSASLPLASDAQGSFGAPGEPTSVGARAVAGGVKVTWKAPAAANPAITKFVVSGGPGSCPVVLGSNAHSTLMPAAKGQSWVRPRVQAVNAYGYSPAALAPRRLRVIPDGDFRNVQILQFSDFHGALEASSSNIGAAVLETAFERDRKYSKSTFTAVSGDSIGGAPPISSAFEERPTIEALNLMGVDVSTFGNHEHDRTLAHLRQMIDLSKFKWTVANYSTLGPLKGKKNSTRSYVIVKRGGVKVGFVGMNTPETTDLVKPGNLDYAAGKAIKIGAGVGSVQAKIDAARKAGADVVIALVHQGWSSNEGVKALGPLITVAGQLRRVAGVYGGHTHQPYMSIVGSNSAVETRNSGQQYSRLQICLNRKTGKVTGAAAEAVNRAELASVKPDPATAKMVAGYQKQLGAKYDVKLGSVNGVFPRGGTPPVERSGETPMGDVTADALRASYGTDIVITNGGGIRDSLPAAGYIPNVKIVRPPGIAPYDVLLGDIMTVYPFSSNASTTTMTGQQLWKAIENGVSKWPGDGRFPQISGFKFSFNPDLAAGSRVRSITKLDGTPIQPDATVFTVTTLSYMVEGGDGYIGCFNQSAAKIHGPYEEPLVALLKADLAAGRVTSVPSLDGRILRVGG